MSEANVISLTDDPFVSHYSAAKDSLPGADLGWVSDLRAKNIALYGQSGLPTPRVEDWKFTNLNLLNKQNFALSSAANTAEVPFALEADKTLRIAFVEGRFSAEQSSKNWPAGVSLESFAAALEKGDESLNEELTREHHKGDTPLVALNTALMTDGFVLTIAAGTELEETIEIVHLGSQSAELSWHSRNVIRAGEKSRATILERIVDSSESAYFANTATTVVVGDEARLHHYRVQAANSAAFLISHTRASVGKSACYDSFILNTGARLARNDIAVRLEAEQSSCHINGAYMADGDQHSDITTHIDHLVPNTTCDEVFKGVLAGKSRGVFQGKIVVHQDAQKTVGNQSNRVLLLSETAEVDAKPELEIFADDVICSHGCTSGQMDDTQLFYMQARGLSKETAQRLLVQAFLSEAVEEMQNEELQDFFFALIEEWLAQQA
ncbi:Fe-S cluster assembly protein SufD [Kiloniella sp. b19]|uniref:Fe-S cluster assembly protein SufD n=1 Tax=Kiloniella sp. GXU_MW_B19 TaxID=3141326 RepID=UPI0031D44A53